MIRFKSAGEEHELGDDSLDLMRPPMRIERRKFLNDLFALVFIQLTTQLHAFRTR